MKKFIILLILLVPLYNLYSDNGYRKYLDTNKNFNLYDISKFASTIGYNYLNQAEFIDSLNGLISFGGGFYKTTDGGTTWSEIYSPNYKINDTLYGTAIYNFCYIDSSNIVAKFYTSYFNKVYKTCIFAFAISNDAGCNWQFNTYDIRTSNYKDMTNVSRGGWLSKNGNGIQFSRLGIYKTDDYFYNMSFIQNNCDLLNKLDDSIPLVKKIDEDRSGSMCDLWANTELMDIPLNLIFDNNRIICPIGFSYSNIHNIAYSQVFIRTDNDFNTFEYAIAPDTTSITPWKNYFIDWNKIWCCNYYLSNNDNLYHLVAYYTSDFGKTWNKKLDFATFYDDTQYYNLIGDISTNQNIAFKNDSIGIITSAGTYAYLTTDGGDTWKNILKSAEGSNSLDITYTYFKDNGDIILLCSDCDDIITYKIHPDTTKTVSVNTSIEITDYNYFYSYPSYPCPASTYVNCNVYWDLSFNLKEAIRGVYDSEGNKVANKNEITINQTGTYSAIIGWNCSMVDSGPYFIPVNHNGKMDLISIMVVK